MWVPTLSIAAILCVISCVDAFIAVPKEDKVTFAIDHVANRKAKRPLKWVSLLFDTRVLKHAGDITSDIDLVAFADFGTLLGIYGQTRQLTHKYIEDDKMIMHTLGSKTSWTSWMMRIGQEDHLPVPLNVSQNSTEYSYPVVLKTSGRAGHGAFTYHTSETLEHAKKQLKAKNQEYVLEEAITSASEIHMWGSAFQGRLLSMRCLKKSFDANELMKSNYLDEANPLVHSTAPRAKSSQWVPCSRNIVDVLRQVMTAARYSGAWCAVMKLDAEERLRFVDMDAHYCEELSNSDGLFLMTMVPLSFAVAAASPGAKINRALYNGTLSRAYLHIQKHEEGVLSTGGGFFKGKWLAVSDFDPELQLDPIEYFYSRRHLQSRIESA